MMKTTLRTGIACWVLICSSALSGPASSNVIKVQKPTVSRTPEGGFCIMLSVFNAGPGWHWVQVYAKWKDGGTEGLKIVNGDGVPIREDSDLGVGIGEAIAAQGAG